MFIDRKAICAGLLTAVFVWMFGMVASAEIIDEDEQVKPITMELNQSYYLNVVYQIQRVAIANPQIADVKVLGATDLNIIALGVGSTSLTIWTKTGAMLEYVVTVVPTESAMARVIEKAIGLPNVHVDKVDERIVLRGTVKDQKEVERAIKIAGLYLKSAQTIEGEGDQTHNDKIVSLLEMESPVQINLEALVLDVSTANTSNFGFQYANAAGFSQNDTGGMDITFGTVGTFYGGQNFKQLNGKPFLNVDVQIQALVQKGLAKVLSRPHITTLSGETAEIMIGGSLPIPVSNTDGAISVEWKDYGIKLHVEPKLDKDNRITSKIDTEVSTLDYDHAVTSSVGTFPAMTKRTANAVINVESGMTMVIGGLLNSQDGKTIKKIPLLGDIPIIGEFFKHTSKTKDKRELMILIKPRIVENGEPAKMSTNLKDYYDENKKFADTRQEVDLNAQDLSNEEETVVQGANVSIPEAEKTDTKADDVLSNTSLTNPTTSMESEAPTVPQEEAREVPMLEMGNSFDLPPMVDIADDPDRVSDEIIQPDDELEEENENIDSPAEEAAAPLENLSEDKSEPPEEVEKKEEEKPQETESAQKDDNNQAKTKELMLVVADKLSEINDIIRQAAGQNN